MGKNDLQRGIMLTRDTLEIREMEGKEIIMVPLDLFLRLDNMDI